MSIKAINLAEQSHEIRALQSMHLNELRNPQNGWERVSNTARYARIVDFKPVTQIDGKIGFIILIFQFMK